MRPFSSTNHMLPSAPAVMSPGPLFGRGRSNSVTVAVERDAADLAGVELGKPDVAVGAGRQRARAAVGRRNRELGDHALRASRGRSSRRRTRRTTRCRLRPSAVARGWLSGVGMSNSVMTPAGVMRPIRLPRCSENQKLPSDPSVMIRGELFGVRQGEFDEAGAVRRHAADAVARALGEPQRAVAAQSPRWWVRCLDWAAETP